MPSPTDAERARLPGDEDDQRDGALGVGRNVHESGQQVAPGTTRQARTTANATAFGFSVSDLERRFALLVVFLRTGVLGFSLIVVVARGEYSGDVLAGASIAAAWCIYTWWRGSDRWQRDSVTMSHIAAELVLAVAVAAATGGVESPFALLPLTALMLLGFVLGDRSVTALAVVGVAVIASTVALQSAEPQAAEQSTLLGAMYLLAGVLGTSARRLLDEASQVGAQARDEARQLTEANDLLVSLNQVARTLPSSFDLGDVVSEVGPQLRALLPYDTLVVLVADEASGAWLTEVSEGVRLPDLMNDSQLPLGLRDAADNRDVVVENDSLASGRAGCSALSRSGLYTALRSRGAVVGLLAVEYGSPSVYGDTEMVLLREYSVPLALAIDNARWFGRLRRFGADAERSRIARDLHDRLAQSLVYVGFELDRLSESVPVDDARHDSPATAELAALRAVVGDVLAELRETLYELRSRVTADTDLAELAGEYVRRYQTRTGIRVTLDAQVERRLALPIEQELWLILLEALTNVQRHSGAAHAIVRLKVDARHAIVDVRDGGTGFDPSSVRPDSFGIVGIRERADAIGAHLSIESTPGSGTRIRVELPVEQSTRPTRRSEIRS